jgi:hypothetical protein
LIAVFYRYQFRTKKSLEMSMDWLKPSSMNREAYESLCRSAEQLLAGRKEMCEYPSASDTIRAAELTGI